MLRARKDIFIKASSEKKQCGFLLSNPLFLGAGLFSIICVLFFKAIIWYLGVDVLFSGTSALFFGTGDLTYNIFLPAHGMPLASFSLLSNLFISYHVLQSIFIQHMLFFNVGQLFFFVAPIAI